MTSRSNTVTFDLSKQEVNRQILPYSPVFSSHTLNWEGIYVQHYQQPAWETPECNHSQHAIVVHPVTTSLARIERRLNGRWQDEQMIRGEFVLVPAGAQHQVIWNREIEYTLLLLEPTYIARIAREEIYPESVELVPRFAQSDPLIYQIGLALNRAYTPKDSLDAKRGNPEQAFAQAAVKLDRTYTTPIEHHNPIELISTIAQWQGEQLTIYEPTQWVLGITPKLVRFELGDTRLPKGPLAAGSRSTASVGAAVQAAANAVRSQMIQMAIANPTSELHGYTEADIFVEEGRMFVKSEPSKSETYTSLLKRIGKKTVEAYRETLPPGADNSVKNKVFSGLEGALTSENNPYSMHSFGAQFCEVRVDADLGTVQVSRFVGAYGAGRIINRKTAESQLRGAVVMGIGAALLEETVMDAQRRHIVNPNLGEYHVAVNADVPELDVFFVEEEDNNIGALGAKGVGELGIVGVAAAIANAIFHATGKRVRELPITPDKLL